MKRPVSSSWIILFPGAGDENGICHRWQSVAWKPIIHFDVTTLDDVKANANTCGINACFARDDIINLSARRFVRNEYYASRILGQNRAVFYPAQQALTGDSYSPQGFPRQHGFRF